MMFCIYNKLKNIVRQKRHTGGATLPEDIVLHLSPQDELCPTFQGFVTDTGKYDELVNYIVYH